MTLSSSGWATRPRRQRRQGEAHFPQSIACSLVRTLSVDSRRVSPVRLFRLKVGQITCLLIRDDSFKTAILWYKSSNLTCDRILFYFCILFYDTCCIYNEKIKDTIIKKWVIFERWNCTSDCFVEIFEDYFKIFLMFYMNFGNLDFTLQLCY